MIDDAGDFTAEQAAAATGALREALGLPPQRFGTEQFVGMISDEIEQLRAAGRSDGDISRLLSQGSGIEIGPEALARFDAGPGGRSRPA